MIQIGWYTLKQNTSLRNFGGELPCWYEDVTCFAGKYAVYADSYKRGRAGHGPIWTAIPGIIEEDYRPHAAKTPENMANMCLPYDRKQHIGRISEHRIEVSEDKLAEVVAKHEVYESGHWELLSNFESHCSLYKEKAYWSIIQSADGDEILNCGYGLYLNSQEADALRCAYAKAWDMDPSELALPVPGLHSELIGDGIMCDYSRIQHLDGQPHAEDCKKLREGLFLYADAENSGGGLALLHTGQRYPGIRKMADACRRLYSTFLPPDFNYESHMVFSAHAYDAISI